MEIVKVTNKIDTITDEHMKAIRRAPYKKRRMMKILGLKGNYHLGDSAVAIDNAQVNEVYYHEWKGKKIYYLVVFVMSKDTAFCWILTEVNSGGTEVSAGLSN